MSWFYDMLMDIPGFNSTAASWATAVLAGLLVYAVVSFIRDLCK